MTAAVPFREALRAWLRIGLESFGGPAGQIAVMHRVLVAEKRWIGEERFLHALSYCMLLPGPEAQQLATYVGWLLHGTRGGLAAGLLFVLPGALVMSALALGYAAYGAIPLVAALFFGVKAAVLALVVEALLRVGRRALRGRPHALLALAAFVGLFCFAVPYPLIIAAAAAIGLALDRIAPIAPSGIGSPDTDATVDSMLEHDAPAHVRPSSRRALRVGAVWLAVWLAPIAALCALLGPSHLLTRIALFFSQLAVVTFGGAYAVLAYVAQQAVAGFGWLTPGQMLDGLGLAETTPGPLILVLQFVAQLAAWNDPGGLPRWLASLLAGALALWVTFAPCFLWIFVGAPYIEALRGSRVLRGALTGITAAVVGVILNLAVWFSLHVLFGRVDAVALGPLRLQVPVWSTLSPAALAIALAACVATLRFQVGMLPLLATSAAAGLAMQWRP